MTRGKCSLTFSLSFPTCFVNFDVMDEFFACWWTLGMIIWCCMMNWMMDFHPCALHACWSCFSERKKKFPWYLSCGLMHVRSETWIVLFMMLGMCYWSVIAIGCVLVGRFMHFPSGALLKNQTHDRAPAWHGREPVFLQMHARVHDVCTTRKCTCTPVCPHTHARA